MLKLNGAFFQTMAEKNVILKMEIIFIKWKPLKSVGKLEGRLNPDEPSGHSYQAKRDNYH